VGAIVILSCVVLPACRAEAMATRPPIGFIGNGDPTTMFPQVEAFRHEVIQ
jgi:hypothetical protein